MHHHLGRLHPHHRDAPIAISGRARAAALGVLCLCAFTTATDLTITNVALPFIATDLDASTSSLQWVVDAYNIALAGLLVLGGGLADRFGRRRVFLMGWAVFGVGCLVAAFSSSTGMLIGARTVMGVGAAGVIAPALAIVAGLYPPERRGFAIGVWALFGAAGLAAGPTLGGVLLDTFWWGSVFLVNVPVIVVGLVLGVTTIPESTKPDATAIDASAALASVVGLGGVVFAIIEGPDVGWLHPSVVVAVLVGVGGIVSFVVRELAASVPLFDVRIVARRVVGAGAVTLLVTYVVLTGLLFLMPQFLQGVAGESVVVVGLLMAPFALTFGIASMGATKAAEVLGARTTITLGLAGTGVGMALLALALDHSVVWTVLASSVVALGLALLITPASTVVMNDLRPEQAGHGSSLNMVSRFVGAAVGVAVIGSVFAARYVASLGDATSALSDADAASAQGSIAGAVAVAGSGRYDTTTSSHLVSSARSAFVDGATAGYLLAAGVALVAAAIAWWALSGLTSSQPDTVSPEGAQAEGAQAG